jgi:hypothetical protein
LEEIAPKSAEKFLKTPVCLSKINGSGCKGIAGP